MDPLVTIFDPQPTPDALPPLFPSPFDELGPHPLARRAAQVLEDALRSGSIDLGLEGKMFGVLVVRTPEGRIGFLRAFSGMIGGRWVLPGFVPPAFDPDERERIEVPGEAAVRALTERFVQLERSGAWTGPSQEWETLQRAHAVALAELRARHGRAKVARRVRREALARAPMPEVDRAAALHALDQESRRDKAELRTVTAQHREARGVLEQRVRRVQRRRSALVRLRAWFSRRLVQRLHDTYRIANLLGEARPLRSLFAPREPPSGAADCAAPKLLAAAQARGLRPIALAEFWWGPPPPTGARVAGTYYPACKEKCTPLLPFMLEGLDLAAPRRFVPPDVRGEALPVVFEDACLVVIDKPCGLLSVPGTDARVGDSVLERLRARYPGATGPLLVHRLDLDTSGLLVACLDARAHAAVQKQFLQRTVEKRYLAELAGEVRDEHGRIELALRVDLHDRPRQIHDPVHGKRAITDWQVLARRDGRTRIAFFPRTGRTHQLRVHAAHPRGLDAPIIGDRIYGQAAERLLLHAESLAFTHPMTGERLAFERPAPF